MLRPMRVSTHGWPGGWRRAADLAKLGVRQASPCLLSIPKIMTRPAELRKSYLNEVAAFQQRLREGCEKNQCHYVLVNTKEPLHEVLSGYLAFRLRTTTR